MKKYLTLMAFAMMAVVGFSLISCGDDESNDEEIGNNSNASGTPNSNASGTLTVTTPSSTKTYQVVNTSCKDFSQKSLSQTKLTLYGELTDDTNAWWGEMRFRCDNSIGGKKTLSEINDGDEIWNLINSTWQGETRPKNSDTMSGVAIVKAISSSRIKIEFNDYAFYQWSSTSNNKWLVTLNGEVSFPITVEQ